MTARIESENSRKGRNSHTIIHAQLRRREPPDRASHTARQSPRPSVCPSARAVSRALTGGPVALVLGSSGGGAAASGVVVAGVYRVG